MSIPFRRTDYSLTIIEEHEFEIHLKRKCIQAIHLDKSHKYEFKKQMY